jgi:hypothetical protein
MLTMTAQSPALRLYFRFVLHWLIKMGMGGSEREIVSDSTAALLGESLIEDVRIARAKRRRSERKGIPESWQHNQTMPYHLPHLLD